ncbi:metal-dependent transcriptional regulator [Gordonia insulae]|uniref:Iron-dependent repressor IdeR n=1 Tax=Gordonia insulae TaxID=2420509 RepID=A0A3G8JNS5_9ACTN|nr:metal-dependent transcriptional regulator [Gordonia insulae]AZG46295.1 Iron-dependent repressor IdeR [Gordonia insulae]
MNRLIDTAETYVRTIYNLGEDGVIPRRARLSERLGQAGPTVTQTVARLERDGLIDVTADHHLALTEHGRQIAVAVTRKHRIAERMLADVIGLPTREVHAEASRWEHVISDEAERGIVELLDDPSTSPWGNPIPGLDQLGVEVAHRPPAVRLAELGRPRSPLPATVRSISEDAQSDDALMAHLVDAGIIPGARIRVEYRPGTYLLRGLDAFELSAKRAHIIQLDPIAS